MPHPNLTFRFIEEDDWAVFDGPAVGGPVDPHVLVLHAADPPGLAGLLLGISVRKDCVRVRYRLDPVRGVFRGEATFMSALGAGDVAAHMKKRGLRLHFHPVVLDRTWWEPYASGLVPDGHRWRLPIGENGGAWEEGPPWPWSKGRAYTQDKTSLPTVKICLCSWDRKRMDAVLAALTHHPRCFGVKGNHPQSASTSYLGRAVFIDDATTGWVARQLGEQCPDVYPVVQDDGWFKKFR